MGYLGSAIRLQLQPCPIEQTARAANAMSPVLQRPMLLMMMTHPSGLILPALTTWQLAQKLRA